MENKNNFDPVIDLLTPKATPPVPHTIKSNVLSRIRRRQALKNFITMKSTTSKLIASAASLAAVVTVAVVAVKPIPASASETRTILDRSLAAADEVQTMVMTIDVRTRPHESFAYTNPLDPMEEHTLTVVRGETPRWRLDKTERHVVFDGATKYLWIDGQQGTKGTANDKFEEWFEQLLDPRVVPMREKAALDEGVKYHVEETADETILRADVKARGDFSTSDYLMYSSIEESNTRRELVFDRATGLLKNLRVWVKAFGNKILIAEVKRIDYDVPVDLSALLALPSGATWRDASIPVPAGRFSGITASEAARAIADAITAGNIESVREVFEYYDFAYVRRHFQGAKVTRVDEPFRSGSYGGVFVPMKVQFANGKTEKLKIALRNDNPNRVWLVDGGI
jgi:hypothetical protein